MITFVYITGIIALISGALLIVLMLYMESVEKKRSKNTVQEEPGFVFESGECDFPSQEKKEGAE